ncbi:phosphotransferase [Streptomyces sp. NPDC026294]|uniref:phosphotransferase n=1 Tax=Streptomyces sp. NPDC026294 TaxID=3155362 RepID=UPI0033DB4D5B
MAGGGPGAARRAVLRDGARRGPRTAGRHALHVRGELAARRYRRAARGPGSGHGLRPRPDPRPGAVGETEFLSLPGGGSALRRHVTAQRAYYAWVVAGQEPSPLIERGFAWLADHWPTEPEEADETVLTWGDARIGNIVYDGFTPAAVLDWEMAVPGPRELDLGWLIYLHRFFQDLAESGGQRGLPGLLRRDHVEERYARLAGHPPRAMDFHILYAALRHAVVMLRVAYRQVHFGEMPAPADPDALIMHRAALEAMIEGRYRHW